MRAPLRNKENLLLRYAGLLGLLLVMAETVLPEQLPVKPYTIADGLAHDDVNQIVRDSRGFLWFCTEDGLSRFDGSGGTEVDIEFRVAPNSLFLSVSDDGRGFDLSEESDGHGLVSMRERIREMGGTLDMTSHVGSGTTITLQVPMTDQV